jgi:adenylylsulfate kinase
MDIHPVFDRLLQRSDKEALLGQRGLVVWLYGLSGSGKSTLAAALERELHAAGRLTRVLDGDNLRTGLNRDLGFSDADRAENIRRTAEVARLFADSGVIVIASFICPTRALRQLAREIIGAADFLEVYVHASYTACARRDPKGLYAKAGAGQVSQFTGRDSAFEEPALEDGCLRIDTEAGDPATCADQLHGAVRRALAARR